MAEDIGAIFDWDGVIIDSHDQHRDAWFRLAEELGTSLTPELFKTSFGLRNERIIPEIFQWAESHEADRIRDLGDRKEAVYREILKETGIQPLPGVRELLAELKAAGVPCAVGSSTSRLNIETVIEVADLGGFFETIVAAEDVTRGKPEPDVFLKGAERIGREPAKCVVFEDAFAGIEAGRRGGMKVVGVGTTNPKEQLTEAHLAVDRLTEVSLRDLVKLIRS